MGNRIVKHEIPHTIAEELILSAAIALVSTMKGKAAQRLKLVPLSNDLVEKHPVFKFTKNIFATSI